MSLPKVSKHENTERFYNTAASLIANKVMSEATKKGTVMSQRTAMSLAWSIVHEEPNLKVLTFKKLDGTVSRRVVSNFVWNYYTPKGTQTPRNTYKFVDMALLAFTGASFKSIRSCNTWQVLKIEVAQHVSMSDVQSELEKLTVKPS